MIILNQVTLISLSSIRICETIKAMEYSMRKIRFADAILFTNSKPTGLTNSIRYIHVDEIKSVDDYNRTMLFDIYKYIISDYVLIVQWDGFVVNPDRWKKCFLEYDYIGAPWPSDLNFRDEIGRLCRVGNGVSLRSRRIMEYPSKYCLNWAPGENEDVFLCCIHRCEIEKKGMKIAPLSIACQFSHERPIPENKGIKPFMFHKWDGDNVQYPRFGEGLLIGLKRMISKLFIKMKIYEQIHIVFRKVFR